MADRRAGQKSHIYVKQIGEEPPFPLTNEAADDSSPAWSPDGQSIAFIRELKPKKWALMLIPQRGGTERQLESWDVSKMGDEIGGPYLAWTPDSNWLAYPYLEPNTNTPRLFLISVVTGEKRRLTTPSRDKTIDTSPAFSPDGSKLVFIREAGFHSDLYMLRLGKDYKPQGEPRKVETGFPDNNFGITWMPNGQEIVFSAGNGKIQGLYRMDISKPGKPVSLGLPSDNSWAPSISRTGNRLVYAVVKDDANIWRVDLEGPSLKPGRPVPFIFSTKFEGAPAYSYDGKRIAFVSERSGSLEIWICGRDGTNPVQMTSFGGPNVYGPKWSPDGRKIAFHAGPNGNMDIYVVSADRGVPKRMTTHSGSDSWPFWSHDGQWLYFKSAPMKNDVANIWKMPSQGGEAIQVTHLKEDADVPQESPDGKFLYFCRGYPFTQSVWRIPVEGGEETKVLDSVHPLAHWTLRQEGIYYFTPPDGKGISTLNLYELAGGKNKKILETDRELAGAGSVAVSPDGRTILYSQIDELGVDLMMVENFK